jgi:short-subunit dehydrogenase
MSSLKKRSRFDRSIANLQNLPPPIAVVTGASSGIGEATARRLAQEGFRVVLVARRGARLKRIAGEIETCREQVVVIPADLSTESERRRLHAEIRRRFGEIDVLVNSAGFGWYGYGDRMSWKTARQLLGVNVVAVVHLSLLFLREMRRRDHGHIINIGSIAGGIPSQGIALYGATKSFLDSFTTALHRELSGTGVHVSVIRSGPVRSEFGTAALRHPNGFHVPTGRIGVTADRVAASIWGIIRHPRRVVYVPAWLCITPWIEMTCGWIIDRIGPLLLKRNVAET